MKKSWYKRFSLREASRFDKIIVKSKYFQANGIRKPNGDYTSSDEEELEYLFETHLPGCVDLTPSNEPKMSFQAVVKLGPAELYPINGHLIALLLTNLLAQIACIRFCSRRTLVAPRSKEL